MLPAIFRTRRAVRNYLTAVAINVGVLMTPTRGSVPIGRSPIVVVQEQLLVDDCWHPGEVLASDPRQVLVATLDAAEPLPISAPLLSQN